VDIVSTLASAIETLGLPVIIILGLYLLIVQGIRTFREDQSFRAKAFERESEFKSQLLALNAQSTQQIDMLRRALEQVAASERLALDENLKAIQANTDAIHGNTQTISVMQQSFVSELSRVLENVGAGQRALVEHISSLAVAASAQRDQIMAQQNDMADRITALDTNIQRQSRGIDLLTSTVAADTETIAAATAQQKEDAKDIINELRAVTNKLESLPEQVAAQLRPTLEPLVQQVQRLVEEVAAMRAPALPVESGGKLEGTEK
jgi:hypothetical protein